MKSGNDIPSNLENCSCPLGVMMIAYRKLSKVFRAHFSKLNVTNSQVSIFMLLMSQKELTQKEIGEMLELEKSTVSRDLVRLFDGGFLYKAKSDSLPVIGLTAKGVEMGEKIMKEWQNGYKDAEDYLGERGMIAVKELESSIIENKK